VKALLVDLYETLVWTDWGALSDRLVSRLGVDISVLLSAFEATSAARGTGHYGSVAGDFGAILAACSVPDHDAIVDQLSAEIVEYLSRNIHLYDDVVPALRRARAAGTRVALVSNCDHATRPIVDALGLEAQVDTVLLSCEVKAAKPDPAIFLEALRRLQAAPEDSVFVDDQPRFLDGAAALGIRTVRIARHRESGSFGGGGIDRHPVIVSLEELV
jgi:putative hydrolase of the HAD superfamily